MPATLSIRAYAARIGADEANVRKLVARGLPLTADRRIDPQAADAWRARYVSPAAVKRGRPSAAARAATAPAAPEPPVTATALPPAAASPAVTVSDIKTILADPAGFLARVSLVEAERLLAGVRVVREAKAMEREGADWVRVADVVDALRDQLVTVRTRLLSIPGSLAARVAHSDPARAERVMLDAIRDALEELSGEQVAKEAQEERVREEARKGRRRSGSGRAAGFKMPPGA